MIKIPHIKKLAVSNSILYDLTLKGVKGTYFVLYLSNGKKVKSVGLFYFQGNNGSYHETFFHNNTLFHEGITHGTQTE